MTSMEAVRVTVFTVGPVKENLVTEYKLLCHRKSENVKR
jgi:hypothetical protein